MILGVSEKKDMSEACARFISWTQFGPLGLFGPLNAKQNLLYINIYIFVVHNTSHDRDLILCLYLYFSCVGMSDFINDVCSVYHFDLL
jgi:hypothetical protein